MFLFSPGERRGGIYVAGKIGGNAQMRKCRCTISCDKFQTPSNFPIKDMIMQTIKSVEIQNSNKWNWINLSKHLLLNHFYIIT